MAAMRHLSSESRWDAWRNWVLLFNWAETKHGLPSPLTGIKPPQREKKRPRALSYAEEERVVAKAYGARQKALVLLILDTGLRVTEIANLKLEDLTEDFVRLRGKVGDRLIPISPQVRERIRPYLPMNTNRRDLWVSVSKCVRRAGIPAGGPHMLRHTMAVQYIRNGGDVFSLQRILGHSNIATTRIYVEMAMVDVIHQHSKFSPALTLDPPRPTELFPVPLTAVSGL